MIKYSIVLLISLMSLSCFGMLVPKTYIHKTNKHVLTTSYDDSDDYVLSSSSSSSDETPMDTKYNTYHNWTNRLDMFATVSHDDDIVLSTSSSDSSKSSEESSMDWSIVFDNVDSDKRFAHEGNDYLLRKIVAGGLPHLTTVELEEKVKEFPKHYGFVSPQGKQTALQKCKFSFLYTLLEQLPTRPYKTKGTFVSIAPNRRDNNGHKITSSHVKDFHVARWNLQKDKISSLQQ